MPPASLRNSATHDCTDPSDATSSASILIPVGPVGEGLRQVPVTRCPSFMSRIAMAAPMPEDAPVTRIAFDVDIDAPAVRTFRIGPKMPIYLHMQISVKTRGRSRI